LKPDLHDGRLLLVESGGRSARVLAESYAGEVFEIIFNGVDDVESAGEPAGMTLYAFAEMEAETPSRRFVFVNWDEEEDERRLEIVARSFTARRVASGDRD
jgi:hypothetical protein